MKKNTFIGLQTESQKCCVLYSIADWNRLESEVDDLCSSDFEHYSTNWNGRDYIGRTLQLEDLKPTGRALKLKKPIAFTGYDTDHFGSSDWKFTIDTILEVEK